MFLVSKSRILYSFPTFFVEKVAKIAYNLFDCEQNVWPQTFLLDEFIANFRWIRDQHFLILIKVKGTVSRDFLLQVFFMNHLRPSP